jgi:hypothetical protein
VRKSVVPNMAITASAMVRYEPARLRSLRTRRERSGVGPLLCQRMNTASRAAEMTSGPMTLRELQP